MLGSPQKERIATGVVFNPLQEERMLGPLPMCTAAISTMGCCQSYGSIELSVFLLLV